MNVLCILKLGLPHVDLFIYNMFLKFSPARGSYVCYSCTGVKEKAKDVLCRGLFQLTLAEHLQPNLISLPSRELTYPPDKALLKMIFLFPRWDMLIPWRVNLMERYFLGLPEDPNHRAPLFFGKTHWWSSPPRAALQAFYRRGLAQDALGKTQVAWCCLENSGLMVTF